MEGERIRDDVCADRLVEIRTVVEKIKPLDQKLSYQVDKLLRTANDSVQGMSLCMSLNFKGYYQGRIN